MEIFTRTKHLRDSALELYLRNDLAEPRLRQVQDHLSECTYCGVQLKEVHSFLTLLSGTCPNGSFKTATMAESWLLAATPGRGSYPHLTENIH